MKEKDAVEFLKEKGYKIENPYKTLIVGGVEYETETHDFDKKLSDIKIPKEWRLWTIKECISLFNSHEKELNLSDCWFFIKQPFNKWKDNVAGFNAVSGRASFGCFWSPTDAYSSLGVRFCRDLKKEKLT